jgi:hypothetical protein
MEKEMGYVVAKGPEGLRQVLNDFLAKAKADAQFKAGVHFILYELGSQKSMIKVDMSEWPAVFWHYDLLGRPATGVVKEVISRFVWESCGEREWYFKEKNLQEDASNEEDAFLDWREQIFETKDRE